MRSSPLPLLFALALAVACDSSADDTPDATTPADMGPRDATPDAGDAAVVRDLGSTDLGSTPDLGQDAGEPANDAGPDVGPDAQADAGEDAAIDAGEDAGEAPDAGPNLNTLYASFNNVLVYIDPETAQLTQVGLLRNAANEAQTYNQVNMTWSGSGQTALIVPSYFSPVLGTVDLCTGLVTLGPTMTRAGNNNISMEGMAVDANGTILVSSGSPPNPQQSPTSPYLGTVDPTTGVITDLGGPITSIQNDIDFLTLVNGTLYGFDVDTGTNRLDIFTLDQSTGARTPVVVPTYSPAVPLRVAYDDSRAQAYAWRLSDHNLLTIDLTDGDVVPIGQTHTSTSFANAPSRGFFFAPPRACPN